MPRDTIAQIHEGEAIVPKKYNLFNRLAENNRENKTYNTTISVGDIQVVARETDNIQNLAKKIVKPIRDELRKLENLS